ncbi:MAG: hypothetical protein JRC99_12495 [Deltaproteobacteria bacterium]|nr:hypothetical protein [Deltaproteobacteria bacterium]
MRPVSLERCRMAGMRQPEFRIDSDFFILTIWRKVFAAAEVQPEQEPESRPSRHQVGTKLALSRHQVKILHKCLIDTEITELMEIAGRTDCTKFRNQVLNPFIVAGLLGMTVPDKPRSSKQKYRVTEEGKCFVEDKEWQGEE